MEGKSFSISTRLHQNKDSKIDSAMILIFSLLFIFAKSKYVGGRKR